ncbi:hypothetical protein CPB85DRAFT_230454 [Mucidula mucida]|nr:hypothetical protein CPB85DRAFT_230454 [Mucidula mucida]
MGYIFCDLLNHEYITPDRSSNANGQKSVKVIASYSPLDVALRHKWSSLSKRQTKTLNPSAIFSIIALWQFQATHGVLPSTIDSASELGSIDLTESLSTTAGHEFSPVCAIVGGMLGQDILRTLAAREPPIANFLAFDGNTGGATVSRMSMT